MRRIVMPSSRASVRASLLWLAAIAVGAPTASAMDFYIGTLSVEDGSVVLERCDLGRTRYLLRDAEGAEAVAALRRMPPPARGFWYGEVIGDYVELADGHGLTVSAIEALAPGRSCHLLDALDIPDAVTPAATPPTGAAR